ncbi:DNA-binding protein [Streptomyces sp. NBC_01715]|uniref:DNA-binding protein n=1 Tax=Streptomyces sp. NBC_01715 TaxID=2975916 RepID=UPI002E33E025|nr:DNA-binding protein [Streptomyces sp. NBC_01715]
MVPLPVVQALSTRQHAALGQLDAEKIAVLRVDTARQADDPDRDWIGFSATLGPDALLKALRGWWRCDAASVAAAGVLPVTLSGYVVAVLTGLETWERNAQGRHAFPHARLAGYVTDLVAPVTHVTATTKADRILADLLLGSALASHSGGAIAYVPTNTAD